MMLNEDTEDNGSDSKEVIDISDEIITDIN